MLNTEFDRIVRSRRIVQRGFTLIELLVVVAIIALLVAILLPSLQNAREQGKRATCLSHIKNIATSSRVYEADDPNGWGIPVHPEQYTQNGENPTFIGAYEWAGKSGIGRPDFLPLGDPLGSKYGTMAGFGPGTRPMNEILYKGGFKDNKMLDDVDGAIDDTKLDLGLFRCPGDDGPPRGGHCFDWVEHPDRSSYDHFGNSYAANIFMIASGGGGCMHSNSPYLRPVSRVPTPARTIYFEENIGRWAWAAKNDPCNFITGIDTGPTKSIRGWHGREWAYTRSFVDAHAEYQRIIDERTGDSDGYFDHYHNVVLSSYPLFPSNSECPCDPPECDPQYFPGEFSTYRCVIIRGESWQKDTLPNAPIVTSLVHPPGSGRPSYENCVSAAE